MLTSDNTATATHPTPQQLIDYIAGKLSMGPEMLALESHLESCAFCQEIGLRQPLSQLELRLADAHDAAGRSDSFETGSWKLGDAYQLHEELGRGATGVVYRAVHPGLKRTVALKMLLAGSKAHPRHLARFRREAFALARLNHPHIVTVFDSGEQDGVPYLAMEYIEGTTLAELLRSGPLDAWRAAGLIRVLALAIEHAHHSGILHRDLKPHNVLLQKPAADEQSDDKALPQHAAGKRGQYEPLPWCPKLADFGLARFDLEDEGWQTRTGEFLGTPEYMAPEMMQALPASTTVAVDVYGLGAILYECLTARPPFQGSSISEVSQQVLHSDPVAIGLLRPSVPRDLETICMRCLHKSPAARFQSAAALAEDLRRFHQGESITSRRPSLPVRAWNWCCRNPWRATAVASLLALTFSIPSVGLYFGQRLTQQARIASSNYEATRASLWQVLDHVQQSAGGEIPKLTQLSLAQAKDALALFERLQADDPSPRATLDLIRAHLLVGSLSVMLGKIEDGEKDFLRAAGLSEQLQCFPDQHDEALSQQASAWNKLATITTPKDSELALRYQERAMKIHQRLADQSGGDPRHQSDVAWSHHTLGSIYLTRQDFTKAITHYEQAVRFRAELERSQGPTQALSHAIAGTLVNLALARSATGALAEAEKEYREAIERLDAIRRAPAPTIASPVLLGDWSSALLNYATMIANHDRADESLKLCTQAIDALKPALEREPNVALLRDNLFKHYATRAQLNIFHAKYFEAADDWRQGINCTDDPAWHRHFRIQILVAQSQTSEYRQALDAYDQLLASLADAQAASVYTKDDWYCMIMIPALAYEAALNEPSRGQSRPDSMAEECFHRIVRFTERVKHSLSELQSESDLANSHWIKLKAAIGATRWSELK